MNLQKHNLYDSFRPGQEEAISAIIDAYESGKHCYVLNAPTGTGKSLISIVTARALVNDVGLNKVNLCTPLVSLVLQYHKDVSQFGIPVLMGRKNYRCHFDPNFTCADCTNKIRRKMYDNGNVTISRESLQCINNCPFAWEKRKFLESDIGVTTLDMMLSDPSLKSADCVIVDECANLESKLISRNEMKFPEEIVDEYGPNVEEMSFAWRESLNKDLEFVLQEMENCTGDKEMINLTKRETNISRIIDRCTSLIDCLNRGIRYSYVEKDDTAVVKILNAKPLFDSFISQYKFVVLLSATPNLDNLLPGYRMRKPGHNIQYCMPHPFPVKNRKVIIKPVGKMGMKHRDYTISDMALEIASLHQTHASGKYTIVHCNSYGIAKSLKDEFELVSKIPCILQNQTDRQSSLVSWQDGDGDCVFFSVNMAEGIDLKGTNYPLNIIAKVPFPGLDQYTRDYMAAHPNWYDQYTMMIIEQACGRTTRDLNDSSITYILDEDAVWFMRRNMKWAEEWFKPAVSFEL